MCVARHIAGISVLTDTGLVVDQVKDKKNKESVIRVIQTAIMSKQYGLEDFLARLVTDACSMFYCRVAVLVITVVARQVKMNYEVLHKYGCGINCSYDVLNMQCSCHPEGGQ